MKLKRIAHGILLLALGWAGAEKAWTAEAARPNIIFIFSDDHAWQAIGADAKSRGKESPIPTPNIDRLAHEGMLFTQCYVTNSICGPSRAVIQTGKYSHVNGFIDNHSRFDGSQQTFPKLLQAAGYQTAIVGKWHLVSDPQGFDMWKILPGQGQYYNPDFLSASGKEQITGYATDIITDVSLEWLKTGRDPKKPFMLMIQNKAPHREWEPAVRYLKLFQDKTFPEPETLFDDYSGRGTPAKSQDMTIDVTMRLGADLKVWDPTGTSTLEGVGKELACFKRFTPEQRAAWEAAYGPENAEFLKNPPTGKDLVRWKYQRYMRDYLRCIAAVDENVGRVLKYLDESGLAKNTVVMYSTDQGFYLGEHGWFDKRWMYQESFRMPLLARWPEVVKAGSACGLLASNLDYAETFLDIAGVKVPSDMQGRSLVPLLRGEAPGDWRKSMYYHYYEFPKPHSVMRHEGVFDGRFKLMHFYDLPEWEFFDLKNDPQEMCSRYDDPEMAGQVARMKKELQRLREQYQVPADYGKLPEGKGKAGMKKAAKKESNE